MNFKLGKLDLYWNYLATFLRISSSIILFPLIIKVLSTEDIAIWSIFSNIIIISTIFDFGFNPSFSRNVTYIFSGANSLKKEGIEYVLDDNKGVNYDLLKNLIWSMKRFYFFISLALLLLQVFVGTWYLLSITQTYSGSLVDLLIAWFLLCFLSCFTLLTSYYDVLLQGLGLIKLSKQIWVIGQLLNISISSILLLNGFGLISLIVSQIFSVVLIRILSHKVFFNNTMKMNLSLAQNSYNSDLLKVISPNAIKIGLATLGGLLVSRSTLILGSLFLPLSSIATYGVSVQIVSITGAVAGVYLSSLQPKIAQLQVKKNSLDIKQFYLKGVIVGLITYILFATLLILFGDKLFALFDKEHLLLTKDILLIMFIFSFLEFNHASAGNILLSENKVPFFKSSLFSGFMTVFLVFFFFKFTSIGIYGLILAPGISHLYNNFKWPYEVIKLLKIDIFDLKKSLTDFKII